jgi:phosphatidylserine/phosphatidylglycerophosphate/cardiolipin synthase-like enzyme
MSAECKPEYWFLDMDGKIKLTIRTGHSTNDPNLTRRVDIPQNVLLSGRAAEWQDLLEDKAAKATLAKPYTSGNEVTALIDGKDFMSDLYKELLPEKDQPKDDLQGLDEEDPDFILITGWEFWKRRALCERVPKSSQQESMSALPDVLNTALGEGATMRVLSFANPIPVGVGPRTTSFVEAMNVLLKHSAVLVAPHNPFVSHHQKEVFIARSAFEKSCAYVGGMDLAINRWDDSKHEKREPEDLNFGWHDIQLKVRGDAALQLWANFAERWKDAKKKTVGAKLLDCPVPRWSEKEWKKRPKEIAKQHVQVLRTVGEAGTRERRRDRFMADGEKTVLCGFEKAISKAECYIYIEEQFLWDCELADYIAARMKVKKDLRLIIVMTAGCEIPAKLGGDYAFFLRHAFLRTVMRVQERDASDYGDECRVYPYGLYQLERDGHNEIYVHSKLFIIDDRYVAVGSANVDRRSMHIETEITLGIVDGNLVDGKLGGKPAKVCAFAQNLREKLWKEHLGVTSLGSNDPIEVLKQFPGTGGSWPIDPQESRNDQKHHLRCYIDYKGELLQENICRLLDRSEREWRQ